MNLYVRPNGTAQCLYDEKIPLGELGQLDIKRASHVEPDPDTPGEWLADMAPVGGPLFKGFKSRADALVAEAKWLNDKMWYYNVCVVQ
ncbi:hypothetical protein EBZ80_25190 [bacterium]|nr:hypothetical protein [Betaproteobacteria bacterium]NDE18216.1 hypothetical protein [bacterium]